jgi:ubiquinone/menaquinone biosynthesis C-methylase UbiE
LKKMDAEHLDFADQTFDAVTCAFSFPLFPDIEAVLHEMYRVCKPGGYIGVTNYSKEPPPFNPGWQILAQQFMALRVGVKLPQQLTYTPEELENVLHRCGFGSIETYNETNDIIYASLEEWWAFLLTLPTRAPIMGMNEETLTRFKSEYFAKLRPMFRPDGLHLSLSIIYALAKR